MASGQVRDPSDGEVGGRMDSRANSSGPDGTHKNNVSEIGGSRLDLGTLRARVTHSRSRQLGLESALGDTDDTSRWTSTMATDDQQMAGWESIFIFTLHD